MLAQLGLCAFDTGVQGFSNGWFTEISSLWPGVGLSLQVDKVLYQAKSDFQVCGRDSHLQQQLMRSCGVGPGALRQLTINR